MISTNTVACWPGLFHRISRPNAANRRALRAGGRPGRRSPSNGSWSSRAGCGGRGGLVQGLKLGFDLLAFVVEVGEAGADAGAHGGGCGVGGVGGERFEFEDLGVLRGLDPLDAGLEPGGLGIAVGYGVGVGGGEPGGQEFRPAGSEDTVSEELSHDLVEQ